MISLRCSALPRILSCPASRQAPAIVVEGQDEAARIGTAVHGWLANYVEGGIGNTPGDFALEQGVDADEVSILCTFGRHCWDYIKEHFPSPQSELPFQVIDHGAGITLSGHPDAFSVVDDQVRVVDFKTGRGEGNFDDQLKGYMWLILRGMPETATAWGATIHVRTRSIGDPITMTRQDLDDWYAGLVATVKGDWFAPSHEACIYCPRRLGCPARQQLLADAAGVLTGIDATPEGFSLGNVEGDKLRVGVQAAKHLAGLCEMYLAAAKTEVLIRGHHVDDRRIIEMDEGLQVRTEERRKLKVNESWPVLTRVLSLPVVKECLTISKTRVEKAIGEIAPPRGKAKAVNQVMDELEATGAIEVNEVQQLEVKPAKVIS